MASDEVAAGGLEAEKRVTPLELFFDLVFVFALRQVTGLVSAQPTWQGLGQGVLLLGVLWWPGPRTPG